MQRYACTLTHLKFHAEETSVLFLELMIRTIRSNARHRSSKLCYSILERVKIRGWKGADGERRGSLCRGEERKKEVETGGRRGI